MSTIVEIFMQCDFCSTTYPDDKHTSITLARASARKGGWVKMGGKDMCPDCAKHNPTKRAKPCSRCGSREDVTFEADPFASDMYGDQTPVWMCRECRAQRAADI